VVELSSFGAAHVTRERDLVYYPASLSFSLRSNIHTSLYVKVLIPRCGNPYLKLPFTVLSLSHYRHFFQNAFREADADEVDHHSGLTRLLFRIDSQPKHYDFGLFPCARTCFGGCRRPNCYDRRWHKNHGI
jgi:hypothetical protein